MSKYQDLDRIIRHIRQTKPIERMEQKSLHIQLKRDEFRELCLDLESMFDSLEQNDNKAIDAELEELRRQLDNF